MSVVNQSRTEFRLVENGNRFSMEKATTNNP